MDVIQSQPMVAWNVGLSAPRMPPLRSVVSVFLTFTGPKCSFFSTVTSRVLPEGVMSEVMSKHPLLNAPSILPAAVPFTFTDAFQFTPSRLR